MHQAAAADDVGGPQQQLGVVQLCNPWRPLGATVANIAAGERTVAPADSARPGAALSWCSCSRQQ
jgi:hypothetical protein